MKKYFIFINFIFLNICLFGQKKALLNVEDFDYYRCNQNNVTVFKKGKCGLSDLEGNLFIPMEYEEILDYRNNVGQEILINVRKNGKWGCIDDKNKIVIPFIYDNVLSFKDFVLVEKNGKSYTVDFQNNILLKEVNNINFVLVGAGLGQLKKENGNYVFIDKLGKQISAYEFVFDYNVFRYGYCFGQTSLDYSIVLDSLGNKYDYPKGYSINQFLPEGKMIVTNRLGKKGIIDIRDKTILSCEYDDILVNTDKNILFRNAKKISYNGLNMYLCLFTNPKLNKRWKK